VSQASASPPAPPSRPRLLVVDDEPHIGLLLRPHLESMGYDISLARTLAEARAALEDDAGLPTGLLLDLHLPDGSGLDLLRELRAAGPTRGLPILVLTAEGEERILQDVRRLNAQLLTKPFSPSKLAAHVAAMCAGAKGVGA
jgi:DNA-binding response OmpR family regulator